MEASLMARGTERTSGSSRGRGSSGEGNGCNVRGCGEVGRSDREMADGHDLDEQTQRMEVSGSATSRHRSMAHERQLGLTLARMSEYSAACVKRIGMVVQRRILDSAWEAKESGREGRELRRRAEGRPKLRDRRALQVSARMSRATQD